MRPPAMRSCFRLLLLLLAAISPGLSQELPPSRAAAPLTILQINDVYTIGKVDRGQAGGLARVATLKQQFQKQGKPVLFVLAGDFLSPSLASSVFEGEQMIAT